MEVMSSRSKLIRGHVLKVRVKWLSSFKLSIDWLSCLQGQDSQCSLQVMSSIWEIRMPELAVLVWA